MIEITLKKNWDRQIKLTNEENNNYHVTRDDEHRVLVNFLKHRDEGAMLICGHRGVGKTSSIIAAIHDAQKGKKTLIPVLAKATALSFKHDNQNKNNQTNNQNAEILIHGLIRFLCEAIKQNETIPKKLQTETENLYEKSLASNIHEKRHLKLTRTIERVFSLKAPLSIISVVVGAYMAMGEDSQWAGIAILSTVSLFLAMSGFIKKTFLKQSVTSYYRYDYDFSKKLYEFEQLIAAYSSVRKNKYQLLFVLDEFDKIDSGDAEKIYEIIHPLKMLINQGQALFIFVTAPDIMNHFTRKREKNYTLFSDILFLKRPLFKEMEKYIDSIVCSMNNSDVRDYKNFQNYLCYKSQTDFFDIKKIIRDYIIKIDSSGCPTINIALENYQITQANLQKAIGWIYERKKGNIQSEQKTNDDMLDCLYDAVEKIQSPNKHIIVNNNENTIEYPDEETKSYSTDNLSAVHDFFRLLEEQGYLSSSDDIRYEIIGSLPKFNDESGVYTSEARTFKFEYKSFLDQLVNFANIHSRWIEDMGKPFSMAYVEQKWDDMVMIVKQYHSFASPNLAKTCYGKLTSNTHKYVSKEVLRAATINARDAANALDYASVKLLAGILKREFDASLVESSDISKNPFKRLGVPNQNVSNFSLNFKGKTAFIENIVVMYSPPIDLLQRMQDKMDSHCNIIVCVTNHEFFRSVGNFSIVMDMDSFENTLNASRHPVQTSQDTSNVPDTPKDQAGYKMFFVGFNMPLDDDKLDRFTKTVRKFLEQSVE